MKPALKAPVLTLTPEHVLQVCQEIVDLFHSLAGIPTKIATHSKDWSTVALDDGSLFGTLFLVSKTTLEFKRFNPTYERGVALRAQKIPHNHPKRAELLHTRILQITTLVNRSKAKEARNKDADDAEEVLRAHGVHSLVTNRSGLVSVLLTMTPQKAREVAADLAAFLKQHDLQPASPTEETSSEESAVPLPEDPTSQA